jgi:tetratricopeptide (TPR) repeat protein
VRTGLNGTVLKAHTFGEKQQEIPIAKFRVTEVSSDTSLATVIDSGEGFSLSPGMRVILTIPKPRPAKPVESPKAPPENTGSGGPAKRDSAGSADYFLERGNLMAEEGDWDAAVEYYQKVVAADPGHEEASDRLRSARIEAAIRVAQIGIDEENLSLVQEALARIEDITASPSQNRRLEYLKDILAARIDSKNRISAAEENLKRAISARDVAGVEIARSQLAELDPSNALLERASALVSEIERGIILPVRIIVPAGIDLEIRYDGKLSAYTVEPKQDQKEFELTDLTGGPQTIEYKATWTQGYWKTPVCLNKNKEYKVTEWVSFEFHNSILRKPVIEFWTHTKFTDRNKGMYGECRLVVEAKIKVEVDRIGDQ